jgi:6-pyruvoyltetrahydropterin/6-carboxytetrahydropterin synthase
MTRVTRRYKFAASHRLHSGRFSEEENRELYGKCNNPYGHGHDYVLDVSVTGPVDAARGQVVNIQVLDRLVGEQILRDFDHKYLNADVMEFGEVIPTSENIIRVMEDRLRTHWRESFEGEWPRLEKIRLRETRRNAFELVS